MRNETRYLVGWKNNQHLILDRLYGFFMMCYKERFQNNWDFKSLEGQMAFIDDVIGRIKESWAEDLSRIDPKYDSSDSLVFFNNFRIEVDYFDMPGDGRESMNSFKITCWVD